MSAPIRIAIRLEDGMITNVYTNGEAVDCVIVDHDTDCADDDEIVELNDEECLVSAMDMEDDGFARDYVAKAFKLANL